MNKAIKPLILLLSTLLIAQRPTPKRISSQVQSTRMTIMKEGKSVFPITANSSAALALHRKTSSASIVLVDSSRNGYGLASGYTTPISYNPDEGFIIAYRQWVPDDLEKSGYIGAAFSEDGDFFSISRRLNIETPGAVMGRYPSAVAGPIYPYIIWNEYTSSSIGGGQYGGRPIYTWDQFYYGGGSFFSPPLDLNNGCNPLPCDPPDNWVGSLDLSSKGEMPIINGIYSQWSSSIEGDTSGSSNRWLYHSSTSTSGYFKFEDAFLIFDEADFKQGGFTSNATVNINNNGVGYTALSTYFKNDKPDSAHTILIRKTTDYGKTWSGEGGTGMNETDYYYIPQSVLRDLFFDDGLMPNGFIESSGDSLIFDNPFISYEIDLLTDPAGAVHIFATVFPSASDGFYPFIDESCGIYHFFSIDPSDPSSWEVNFVQSTQVSFFYDDNWRRIYPSAAMSQENSEVLYVSYMALSDTSNKAFNYDVFIQRSTDRGRNWDAPVNVTETNEFGHDEVYPQLASVANDDEAYVVFQSPDYDIVTVDPPDDQADYMNRIFFAKTKFKPLVLEARTMLPEKIELFQNYPNPFNPLTNIEFGLPKELEVSLKVYDLLGNEVFSLANGLFSAGSHKVYWNAGNIASGIYIGYLRAGGITKTSKMILLK